MLDLEHSEHLFASRPSHEALQAVSASHAAGWSVVADCEDNTSTDKDSPLLQRGTSNNLLNFY